MPEISTLLLLKNSLASADLSLMGLIICVLALISKLPKLAEMMPNIIDAITRYKITMLMARRAMFSREQADDVGAVSLCGPEANAAPLPTPEPSAAS